MVDGKHEGNRIYSAMTADFEHFTTPSVFFDPGYEVIDATILQTGSRYHLVFKDERKEPLKKFIQIASGPSIEGPWSGISEPFTESWSEGPSPMKIGVNIWCITITIAIRRRCRRCVRRIFIIGVRRM